MNLPPNHILVSVNLRQNDSITVGGFPMLVGHAYNHNDRESNPVICRVEKGAKGFKKGTWLLCHYNLFDVESPMLLYEAEGKHFFCQELTSGIFCQIPEDGKLLPVCGNLLAERIPITSVFGLEVPEEYQEYYHNRVRVIAPAEGFAEGDVLLTERYADYEICYTWNGAQYRAIKVFVGEIVGQLTEAA